MRVLEWKSASSSAFGVMDAFAALRINAGADPAFGGYLVLQPRTLRRRRASSSAFLLAAGRRFGGLMAVMLVSGLGVTALAAIADCPTCDLGGANTPRLARLAYARQAPIVALDVTASGIFAAMVIEPAEAGEGSRVASMQAAPIATGGIETSAISTAAITPLHEAPHQAVRTTLRPDPIRSSYDWLSAGDALPKKIEPLKDAGPRPLRVAAASPADDGPGFTLPEVAAAAPAIELHAVAVASTEKRVEPAARKQRSWQRYGTRDKASRRSGNMVAAGTGPLAQKHRMPRWAQQMYDNPWQSKAFSYMR